MEVGDLVMWCGKKHFHKDEGGLGIVSEVFGSQEYFHYSVFWLDTGNMGHRLYNHQIKKVKIK